LCTCILAKCDDDLHTGTEQTKKISHNRNKIATTLPRNVVQLIVMDIDALHSALLSITVVSEKLRSAREFLPVTETLPAGLEKFLYEMERDLRLAKATLGGELGFSLCPRCWPPELATIDTSGRLNCPVCGEISYKKAA
jgi:hypothetical protein